ncbi:MAG TPA: DNA-formamidopyrimidine glycosylase [bacterium]|nr:DNA-formamidopyrimidine glycosylase [bacterium]
MPELPEIEITVRELKKKVLERTFVDVWTDSKKQIKKPKDFTLFKKEIKGKKIKNVKRRAKLILFDLSGDKTLLIHQKLTGHLLLGKWEKKGNQWRPPPGFLSEKMNTFVHLLFFLDNGLMLALSDLRKFAKVELWNTKELLSSEQMKKLGVEPLSKEFTFEKFRKLLEGKKRKIKQVLMDQEVIAGIGNIYSDEILFEARINPFKTSSDLNIAELKRLYSAIIKILKKAIKLQGESISDWRMPDGRKGSFDRYRKVYRREGQPCFNCGTLILRKKIGARSTYFCPKCQPL